MLIFLVVIFLRAPKSENTRNIWTHFQCIIKELGQSTWNCFTDFWESNYCLQRKYMGNPIVSTKSRRENEHTITPEHFGTLVKRMVRAPN